MNDNTWYSRLDVQYHLCRHTWHRETALIHKPSNQTIRYLTMHSPQHMQWIRRAVIQGDGWQYYHSLAAYKDGIPKYAWPRTKGDTEEWQRHHHKQMEAYDVLIDIDAGSHRDICWAKESCDKILARLHRVTTHVRLRFTGCGYHIIIPWQRLAERPSLNPDDEDSIYQWSRNYCEALRRGTSDMVDSNLNDPRRIVKVPGSISHYPAGSFVCHEFTSPEEYHCFRLGDYALERYAKRDMRQSKPAEIGLQRPVIQSERGSDEHPAASRIVEVIQ